DGAIPRLRAGPDARLVAGPNGPHRALVAGRLKVAQHRDTGGRRDILAAILEPGELVVGAHLFGQQEHLAGEVVDPRPARRHPSSRDDPSLVTGDKAQLPGVETRPDLSRRGG